MSDTDLTKEELEEFFQAEVEDELVAHRATLGELTGQEVFSIVRRRASITQHDVAKLSGTTQSYLSAWESGRWEPPTKRVLAYWRALASLLAQQLQSEE
jgi:DNA-binding transcriptional regulator YiaG